MEKVATPLRSERVSFRDGKSGSKEALLPRSLSDSMHVSPDKSITHTVSSRDCKSDDEEVLPPRSLSRSIRMAANKNALAFADHAVIKKKVSSKRPGKEREGAEDSGRLLPKPAKRCKLLDNMSEPTAFMRSLEAIVINLERRPDRMQGCVERMQLNCPWLRHSRFDASDGRRDTITPQQVVMSWNTASNVVYQKKRAIRKGWNDLDSYRVLDLDMSPGERGCALSHIRAWQYCLESCGGNQPLLVLEDDAVPTADFTPVLRRALEVLPSNCHVLYLGYSQAADWRREVSQDLVEAEYVWTTVGYLVWPEGAKYFLSHLPVDGPVDNWMAGHCATGEINAYAVRPKIIRQADAWGVNSDVAHSDEHYWGVSSDIQHSDAFYWGNPNPQSKEIDMTSSIWAGLDVESSDESASDC